MRKKRKAKTKTKKKPLEAVGYPARELTEDTRWIVCMWDIKGDAPEETAMVLKRSLEQVKEIIEEAHKDGFYDKVKKHIENYEMRCPTELKETAPIFRFLRQYDYAHMQAQRV